jgi:CheY-like chemotaxis protein
MSRSYTILYVEDDPDDLLIIAEAFEKYTDNLKIIHAHQGYEALQLLNMLFLQDKLPCLIIMDINMPIMDGKETLVAIRRHKTYDNIPIVIFSTSEKPEDKKFAADLEADYITKPIQFSAMEKLVGEFVEKCRFPSSIET